MPWGCVWPIIPCTRWVTCWSFSLAEGSKLRPKARVRGLGRILMFQVVGLLNSLIDLHHQLPYSLFQVQVFFCQVAVCFLKFHDSAALVSRSSAGFSRMNWSSWYYGCWAASVVALPNGHSRVRQPLGAPGGCSWRENLTRITHSSNIGDWSWNSSRRGHDSLSMSQTNPHYSFNKSSEGKKKHTSFKINNISIGIKFEKNKKIIHNI